MSDNDPQDRYFRERRLLLGVSLVLLAHQLLGITVGNNAETLGLRFEFANPSKIWWAVWAIWAWTVVCIVQQLSSIRPREEYPKDRDEQVRNRLADRVAVRRVSRVAIKHLKAIVPRNGKRRFAVAFRDHTEETGPSQEQFLYTGVNVSARWRCDDPSVATTKAAAWDEAMKSAGWRIRGGAAGHDHGECEFIRTVNVRVVPIREERLIRLAATAWTLLSTSFVTDYIAPLAIAAAPVVIVVCQEAAHYSGLLLGSA